MNCQKKYIILIYIVLLSIFGCTKDYNPFVPNIGVWQKVGSPLGLRVEQFAHNSKGDIFIATWWHPNNTNWIGGATFRIERSTNKGMNWQSIHQIGRVTGFRIAIDPNDIIYTGYSGKVERSFNNGNTWETIVDTLPTYIHTIAISPEGCIYLGANGGNYRSKDNKNSWEKLTLEYQANAFLFLENGIILAGVNSGHFPNPPQYIYRSLNNGDTWEQVLLAKYTYGWSMAANQNGTIFAATAHYDSTTGGIYCSDDNGTNWTRKNNGLPSVDICSLAINSLGHIFIGIKDFGVFKSTNDGNTWVNISAGLTDLRMKSLGMSLDDILYVGTNLPTSETKGANIFLLTTN